MASDVSEVLADNVLAALTGEWKGASRVSYGDVILATSDGLTLDKSVWLHRVGDITQVTAMMTQFIKERPVPVDGSSGAFQAA